MQQIQILLLELPEIFFSLNIFNPSLVESTDVDLWIQKVKSIYFLYPNRYSKVI